jgi:uncharacterized protein YciI
VAEWIYLIHPPRERFAETMTAAEEEVWGRHWARIKRLYADGVVVLVGPTFGTVNTGLCVFEAPDQAAALGIMNGDPTIAEGFARGELRPMRVSLLRGRDEGWVRAELESPGAGDAPAEDSPPGPVEALDAPAG